MTELKNQAPWWRTTQIGSRAVDLSAREIERAYVPSARCGGLPTRLVTLQLLCLCGRRKSVERGRFKRDEFQFTAQPEGDTHAIVFVGDDVGRKVKRRHSRKGMGERNGVGKRDDARGSWRKRPGRGYLVITRWQSPDRSITRSERLRGASRRMSGRENLVSVSS